MAQDAETQPAFGSRGLCPACGYPMTLVRITPKSGQLPELRTFRCTDCEHVLMVRIED